MTNINNQFINSNIEILNLKDSELIIDKKSKDYLLTKIQIKSEINFDTRSESETEKELNLESDTESIHIFELTTDSDIEYDSEIDDYINKNKNKNK